MNAFEWNEKKRQTNLEKHGIDFVDAIYIFFDVDRIEWLDTRKEYGESRHRTIGFVNEGLIKYSLEKVP